MASLIAVPPVSPPPPPPATVPPEGADGAAAAWLRSSLEATIVGPGRIDVTAQASAAGPISGYTYTVSRTATTQLLLGVRTGGTP